MYELQNITIAALKKQIELLNKDGVSPAKQELAISAIREMTQLLQVIV